MDGDRIGLGIALGACAYALFSLHDATVKYLVAALPVWQVVFFRSTAVVVGCLVVGRARLVERAIETKLKWPLAARGALTLTAWLLYFTAARQLPLAQLLTLYFSAPLITTLLAMPLLGEKVTPTRWITVGIGFAGVLVALDPGGMRFSWSTVMVLMAAGLWGYAIILMRQIARRESSLLQMFYQNGVFMVVTGTLSAATWQTPTPWQLLLLASIGLIGGVGQYVLFEACRLAPAAVMATVEYSSLIWAFILGWMIFADIPRVAVFAGAALIFASGIFLVVTEQFRLRR
jgi:drug/metabolite transporter (DMT)-like permease